MGVVEQKEQGRCGLVLVVAVVVLVITLLVADTVEGPVYMR